MDERIFNNIVVTIHYFNHRISTPEWVIEPRITPFTEITYIISGEAVYMVDGKRHVVRAGDLVYVKKNSSESAIVNPYNLMECYSFNGDILDISGNEITLPLPLVTHVGVHPDIIAYYQEMNTAWLVREPGYNTKARAIFMIILQCFYKLIWHPNYKSDYDKRIKRVLQYTIDHYMEPLTVNDMAEMIKLSPLYFGRLFKSETGQNYKQYLNFIRINKAENMLKSGIRSVSEVAVKCGFSDIFYFSKLFKKVKGYSPSDIIKKNG
ncbi:MAG TPA: AraC family transcriptional regulator [Clostridiales bacterium]|nr:AraC family transcriptional regulator [Clostridiales bacterium]